MTYSDLKIPKARAFLQWLIAEGITPFWVLNHYAYLKKEMVICESQLNQLKNLFECCGGLDFRIEIYYFDRTNYKRESTVYAFRSIFYVDFAI